MKQLWQHTKAFSAGIIGALALMLLLVAAGPGTVTFPNITPYGVIFGAGGEYHSTSGIVDTTNPALGAQVDNGGNLHITGAVTCSAGCSSSPAPSDESPFSGGVTPQTLVGGFFQTTPTLNALTSGQFGAFQTTSQRALFTNPRDSSGNELATNAHPFRIDPVGTTSQPVSQSVGSNLHMTCDAGCSSSPAPADESAFTAGTTSQTLTGAFFQTTATNNPLLTGQFGALQATANRALFVNPRNSSGTEIGTSGAPFRIDPVGTTTQPVSISGNQAVNLAQVGGQTAVTGGLNGSVGVGGLAANGASTSGNPVLTGCRAQNAEITPVTNGQAVDNSCDLAGKQIVMPFANKENFKSGSANTAATTATTLIAAQGAGVKLYITGLQCYNSGSSTSTITLNDGTSWQGVNIAGGGFNFPFNTPLVVAANTALTFTAGTASTTQYCNAQGYAGS